MILIRTTSRYLFLLSNPRQANQKLDAKMVLTSDLHDHICPGCNVENGDRSITCGAAPCSQQLPVSVGRSNWAVASWCTFGSSRHVIDAIRMSVCMAPCSTSMICCAVWKVTAPNATNWGKLIFLHSFKRAWEDSSAPVGKVGSNSAKIWCFPGLWLLVWPGKQRVSTV